MLNKTIELLAPYDITLNCIREVVKTYNPTFFYVNKKASSIFFSSKEFSLFEYRIKKTIDSKINDIRTEIGCWISVKAIADQRCEINILMDLYLGHSDNQGYLIEFIAEFLRRVEERLL